VNRANVGCNKALPALQAALAGGVRPPARQPLVLLLRPISSHRRPDAPMLIGLTVCAPAFGQVVLYQFTPPPPVTALPFHPFESPSTLQIPNVVPPDRVLKRARPPDSTVLNSHETPRYVPHRGRVVPVPPALVPGQNSYSDRAARCAQAGTAAGIGANHLGAFTTQCAN
jgi:hypothetical protein